MLALRIFGKVLQILWLRLAALPLLRPFAAVSSYSILRTPL
jgi:hypothetical protein